MWKRIAAVFITLVLIISFAACNGGTKEEDAIESGIPAHFITYTDKEGLFSISYPPDWEPALSVMAELEERTKEFLESIDTDAPLEQVAMVFLCGVPTDLGWEPNVNVVAESLPGTGWTQEEYVAEAIDVIKQFFPDYREFSRTDTTIGGNKAIIIELEYTHPEFGKTHQLMMITVVDKIGWTVTCTPETGEYNKSENDFNAIVRSFRVLK